ncbi:hypothetical protein TNCV_2840751 [Trichonephila clavipes]|uniref:Uncharacterized protein n=1 Tax=Trichonephila clavipes TaxID=2585209 RepID=A0A8X6RW37_TRICX|nr:hypothetical protein TNCV_2840751 [Trichonephila clavipes]
MRWRYNMKSLHTAQERYAGARRLQRTEVDYCKQVRKGLSTRIRFIKFQHTPHVNPEERDGNTREKAPVLQRYQSYLVSQDSDLDYEHDHLNSSI